jgi:CDP-diglyceride synthetase
MRVRIKRDEPKSTVHHSLNMGLRIALLTLVGCDPVINIAGANFPSWLFCAVVGSIATAALRPVFAVTRVEPYLGPLILIYPCLAILLACLIYLTFFNRI